ncbi:MAG: ABC transporter permease [Proteobacteria bacterium]|nr:ABC transporter permease [Pseudomonadota bacterium]
MNLHYLVKELYHRKTRTTIAALGLAAGICLLIVINALAMAYRQAAKAPLKDFGADVIVQRSGDVPRELSGAVFPCSAVTITRAEVERIRRMPGVREMGVAVLLWVFDARRMAIVLGIEDQGNVGPAILRRYVSQGRFWEAGRPEVLVETAYARQFGIKPGDRIPLGGETYAVAGLVDASRVPKVATANIYLPLAQAQRIASASTNLRTVSPFAPSDVNLLFITADQDKTARLTSSLAALLGPKAAISTPESFLKSLGTLFALSDKFALTVSFIVIIITVLITFKSMAANVSERRSEIGILKAVGWTNRQAAMQITAESVCQCLIGAAVGLLAAFWAVEALGLVTINIPIPWEMSPSPHFLPGGGDPVFQTLRLPIRISAGLAVSAVVLGLVVGGLTAGLLARHIARIKPSEVLGYE